MNLKQHHLIFIFAAVMISIVMIIESPWLRNKRFSELTHEFNESSFEGVVSGIHNDKDDHNSLKVYYGQNEELDLTWFVNKYQLIQRIHEGDTIIKRRNSDEIVIHSKGKEDIINIRIIK